MSLPKCMDFTDYNRYPGEENPTTDAQMQDFMLNQNLLVKAAAARMWQPSTEYTVGEVITSPSMPAGTEAVCTGAGMSDSALEPSWVVESVVPDGTCFWQLRYVHYTEYLATDDEAIAGEDGEKIVTPSAMRAAINAILAELNVGVKTINAVAPDAGGNINIKDYVSNVEISGKTITVTFKNGTTKTLTTQDTTYSDATTSAAGLMSASDKAKLDGITSGAGGALISKASFTGSLSKSTSSATKTVTGLTALKPIYIYLYMTYQQSSDYHLVFKGITGLKVGDFSGGSTAISTSGKEYVYVPVGTSISISVGLNATSNYSNVDYKIEVYQ